MFSLLWHLINRFSNERFPEKDKNNILPLDKISFLDTITQASYRTIKKGKKISITL